MFSELVDRICVEASRLDLKSIAAGYLNQTIRECHMDPAENTALFFWPNYREDQVIADVDSAFYWSIPNTRVFQGIQAARFDNVTDDEGNPIYAEELIPGKVGNKQDYAFQRTADRIIFKGYGGSGKTISIAYFEYPRSLQYYDVASRPATFNWESETWTYMTTPTNYDQDDTTRETARGLVSNWLLERWSIVLEEGLRAKIYKRLSDDTRAKTCYSLYTQQRLGLQNSELADIAGVR